MINCLISSGKFRSSPTESFAIESSDASSVKAERVDISSFWEKMFKAVLMKDTVFPEVNTDFVKVKGEVEESFSLKLSIIK
jgi:hypothetical protein